MVERSLYSGLIKGARTSGWALYRIADGTLTGKKPFDIGGFDPMGRGVGCEVKLVTDLPTLGRFPWHLFEEHQLTWMKVTAQVHARAVAAIYEARTSTMRLFFPRPEHVGVAQVQQMTKFQLIHSNGAYLGWELATEVAA